MAQPLRRLNGHSQLAQHIDRLEEISQAGQEERDARAELERLWLSLPWAVQEYLAQYDVGNSPSRYQHAGILWTQAISRIGRGDAAVLHAVAGWVLRDCWSKLSWWHAQDLRPQRGTKTDDTVTRELAAQELLRVDAPTLHRLWVEDQDGVEWLRLWCDQGARDVVILERAGVGEPELTLLTAAI